MAQIITPQKAKLCPDNNTTAYIYIEIEIEIEIERETERLRRGSETS